VDFTATVPGMRDGGSCGTERSDTSSCEDGVKEGDDRQAVSAAGATAGEVDAIACPTGQAGEAKLGIAMKRRNLHQHVSPA